MMTWRDDDDIDMDRLFHAVCEEMARQSRAQSAEARKAMQKRFLEAVRECEAAEDRLAVRKLLSETLGKFTYEIEGR